MINLKSATNKTLNIILPSSNKALREVLKDISPKELSTLTKNAKDLSSILDSLFKESTQNETQNKALLELLKNNPTLKSLSNVTSTLKELQQKLQKFTETLPKTTEEKNLSKESQISQTPKEQTPKLQNLQKLQTLLNKTLQNLPASDGKTLQKTVENSGLFLESKLKNFTTPKEDLKNLTQQLSKLLENSKIADVQKINSEIKTLLKSDLFTQDATPKVLLEKTASLLEKLSQKMDSNFEKTTQPKDILFTKEFKELHSQISKLNNPKALQLEGKLKEIFSDDLKAVLNKTAQELQNTNHPQKAEIIQQLDKLSMQIDYYQLLSHLSNATALYIPYSFDAMEEGSLTIKSAKNEKFFCDIDLKLKEYGPLHLRLGLFQKNQLNINIQCQSPQLQQKLQENLPLLREALFKVGIHPKDIRFINCDFPTANYQESQNINLGFEVKA
jgi:hypothetical protein